MCQSIALENLFRTIPLIDEDQKVALHIPFKGTTLFGGKLTKLQKANMECASALTVFPLQQHPSHLCPESYTGHGMSFKRGIYSRKRGRDREIMIDLPLQP